MARKKSGAAKATRPSTALVRREPSGQAPVAGPFEFMRRFGEGMDRAFGRLGPWWLPSPLGLEMPVGWAPQIDVFKRDDDLVVRADVPGLDRKDLKVEVTNEAVVIQGERRQAHEEKRGSVYRSECSYGRFHRSVPLPPGVKAEEARATFKKGVLEVVMPAPDLAASRGRRVEIKEG